jgi:tRNA nucleotidyltransferase (CCA-adding enzyme)
MAFPEWLTRLCEEIRLLGGRGLLVGGFVRDRFLGFPSKDFDLEVYGLEGIALRGLLERSGTVNAVGEQFVVYKFRPDGSSSEEVDVSLPRRESKSGRGHRGFIIEGDPGMNFFEATRRRDFTINALMLDPLSLEVIDPQNGLPDLKAGLLRVVDATTFIEDSLRVLRGAQFAARFNFRIEPETIALCRTIPLDDLPPERVWGEFEKILLKSARPSVGLLALETVGALNSCFPEIAGLKELQDHSVSPEAWERTLLGLDAAARDNSDLPVEKKIALMLAVTARFFEPSPFIEKAESFLNRLGVYTLGGYDVRKQVLALVAEASQPEEIMKSSGSIGDFRRLSLRVDGELLYRLGRATANSEESMESVERFFERFIELGLHHDLPRPIFLGRHLLELGVPPGPRVGSIMREVFERQLDGEVNTFEEARAVALGILARPG